MTNLGQHDYRSQLKGELRRRQLVNARYSLRSFARDLGINPGFLSSILNGRANLSPSKAAELAKLLRYDVEQASEFVRLVQNSMVTIDGVDPSEDFVPLRLEAFHVIANWYHYAILELTYVKDFKATPAWIADRLGISQLDAEKALARLLKLGLLKKTKAGLAKTKAFIATPTDQPSAALRSFHAQLLEKAKHALETQDISNRDITGTTMSIDLRLLPEVKKEIRKFRHRLAKLVAKQKKQPTRVYHLGVQFFELTKPKTENS